MSRITRLYDANTSMLGPNRVEAIAGTSKKARDGHIVEMRGMDTSAFMRSGTILFGHDSNQVVGNPVSGRVDGDGNLRLVIDFAPEGVSDRADEVRRLVKSGVIKSLSIGFEVTDASPLDPKNPRGGLHITRSELLEVSWVAVPADIGAVVTARANRSGKILSGANASALQEAHDHAERCRSTIANVLDGAGEESGGDANDQQQRARRKRQAEVLELAGAAHRNPEFERRQRQLEVINLGPGAKSVADLAFQRRQREVQRLRLSGR